MTELKTCDCGKEFNANETDGTRCNMCMLKGIVASRNNNKLKNLKEIHNEWLEKNVKSMNCSDSIENKLKKEVIKWVKHFRDKTNQLIGLCVGSSQQEIDGAIGFIKEFFNITEEDLK